MVYLGLIRTGISSCGAFGGLCSGVFYFWLEFKKKSVFDKFLTFLKKLRKFFSRLNLKKFHFLYLLILIVSLYEKQIFILTL